MKKKRKAKTDIRMFIRKHNSIEIVEVMQGKGIRHPKWVYTQTGLLTEQNLQAVLASTSTAEIVTTETPFDELFCRMGVMVTGTPEVFKDEE